MPTAAPLTGYTADFPTNVALDSGVLYIGSTVFACLRGGLKFDPGITWRATPFDGMRSKVLGLDRKTMAEPKLSGTMIEIAQSQIPYIEPGAVTIAASQYRGKGASLLLVQNDYMQNVRAVWARGGGGYVQVRFPWSVVTKWDISSADNDEVQIAVEIEARLNMGVSGVTINDMPYVIEYLATVG